MRIDIYKFSRFTNKLKLHFEVRSLVILFIVIFLSGCIKPVNTKPMSVNEISPTSGSSLGGNTLTVTGHDFSAGMLVSIGTKQCAILNETPSTITCSLPPNTPGTYSVIVTNTIKKSDVLSSSYTYNEALSFSNVSPSIGFVDGGTPVTITGTGFVGGATIDFGGTPCIGVAIPNSKTITCTTTAHFEGAVDVKITNPDGMVLIGTSGYIFRAPPVVSSVTPSSGVQAGGTSVTIAGTGFRLGAIVSFGGTDCSNILIVNSTTITCTTAARAAGLVAVSVTNADTQTGSRAGGYTYQAAPTITSVSPNRGSKDGGTTVTLTGTGFAAGATVAFGGTGCVSVLVVSATSITCITPPHAAGLVSASVTNADTQSGTTASSYTFQVAPTFSTVSQLIGSVDGGSFVIITGTGFAVGANVSFGGSPCAGINYYGSTSITCTTTAHFASTVNIVITNPDGLFGTGTAAFTYTPPPAITSVSPSAGALNGGTPVSINGTGFLTGPTVLFGGVACSNVLFISATKITCTTDVAVHVAGAVAVSVANTDGQAASSAGAYTYQAAPTISSVTPNVGALGGGAVITIAGTGFIGATVTIGGAPCTGIVPFGTLSIQCTTPSQLITGAVNVVVTNSDSQSATFVGGYTYSNKPVVTSVNPSSGLATGGIFVTITGSDYRAGATVDFGGVACAGVTFVNSSTLTCTPAAHAAGPVNITVTNTDNGQFGTGSSYTYRTLPTVSSVSPNAGPLAGLNTITITGTGFYASPPPTIDVGGSPCTNIAVASDTSITCKVPGPLFGAVSVAVTNADGQGGGLSNAYNYQAAPTVSNVTPSVGNHGGGTSVTITGTGFIGSSVTFGGLPCTSVLVTSTTTIDCVTPSQLLNGAVNIIVTNSDGQSGLLTNGYMYLDPPTVTSVVVSSGPVGVGKAVTVYGTGFIAGATVKFGAAFATGVTIVDSTTITCTTPPQAAMTVNVVVTNTDNQSGTKTGAYTYQVAPTITGISPAIGSVNGSTGVTITGTGFVAGANISIGGSACTGTTIAPTKITCTTSAHALGPVAVVVTNLDSQTVSLAAAYNYLAVPTITSLSVSSGSAAGGTVVNIVGTNFASPVTARVGGTLCAATTYVNPSSIDCTTPSHASGVVDFVVTNGDGQVATLSGLFTYNDAPTISSVSPVSGKTAAGTLMTIYGTNFVNGAINVKFGGSLCTALVFVDAKTLTCTNPGGSAGAVDVVVTNPDLQTGTKVAGYKYQNAPTVGLLNPTNGKASGSTPVAIDGTNFLAGATVNFGGVTCTSPNVLSSTSLTCITGAHAAGAVVVTVTNPDGQVGTSGAGAYTYQDPPTVNTLSTLSGRTSGGTSVVIDGAGFAAGATITFGGAACDITASTFPTQLTCSTTAHGAGTFDVVVTNTDTQSGTKVGAFTFQAPPTVTNISPATGSTNGSNYITVTGTGFVAGATVTLDTAGTNQACTSVTLSGATSLTCLTPAHAAEAVDLNVTNLDAQSVTVAAGAFTYASMASLTWQVGATSPNPPNPDPYGSTTTNVTHTYTLKNTGNLATSGITITVIGASPAEWLPGTDNCTGTSLGMGASCTVQVTFLGQFAASASYTAILNATAVTGGTVTNDMSGTRP